MLYYGYATLRSRSLSHRYALLIALRCLPFGLVPFFFFSSLCIVISFVNGLRCISFFPLPPTIRRVSLKFRIVLGYLFRHISASDIT